MNTRAVALDGRPITTSHNEPSAAEIAKAVEENPSLALTDQTTFDALVEHLRDEIAAHEPDLSTDRGRKEIASLAYRIARTKTAIDDAGKALNEAARKKINEVDALRRIVRDQLDALRDEARAPLTAWEAAEEARETAIKAELEYLRSAATISLDTTSDHVSARIAEIEARTFDVGVFRGQIDYVEGVRQQSLSTLREVHARILKDEADKAELDRLRAEAAERARQEVEKAEQERREREAAEAAAAEAERIAAAARRAEDAARAEVERRAAEDRDRLEREYAAALQAERNKVAAAERERIEAEQRVASEKAAAEAEAKRLADEAAARAADQAHRGQIMGAAKAAIMSAGEIDEPSARRIVLAIVKGNVPHTVINF